MRPLLIGQAPGRRTDPEEPLSGRCGARLADLCGVELPEFMERFERVNLLDRFPGKAGKGDKFPIDKARKAAIDVLLFNPVRDRRVVMLGGNVAKAFGFPASEPMFWSRVDGAAFWVAFFPHPSGVNRWFNEPSNVSKARRFWTALASRGET